MKTIGECKKGFHWISCHNQFECKIQSIEYDSRNCNPDSLFVAVRGNDRDGHNYIPAALKKGVTAIVGELDFKELSVPSNVIYFKVESCRIALAELSHWFYNYPTKNIDVIGITGTNGKTTLTYLLHQIYSITGKNSGIIGTTGVHFDDKQINTLNTTPESKELCEYFQQMLYNGIEKVFMEVSSHSLEQKRIYGIDFRTAIFTNLTQDHLDYHITMENYFNAKKTLFDGLSEKSIVIVNGDSPFSNEIIKDCRANLKLLVGRGKSNDIIISNEYLDSSQSKFSLIDNSKKLGFSKLDIEMTLTGRFNIENASMAVVQSMIDGIEVQVVKDTIANIKGAPGRMDRVTLSNGATAYVDYAHTPDALKKALLALRELNKGVGRIICVFGCGGDRDQSKRPIMGEIAGELADYAIITSDNPRSEDPDKIIEQIYKGFSKSTRSKAVCITNRDEAIRYSINLSKVGDIVLVAGKGHENYQIIGTNKIPFDDKERIEFYSRQRTIQSL